MATTDTFARDLGYLDQFFGKLEAHAATLSPTAGARLRTLMSEERARWTEIRALMAGAEPAGAARAAGTPARTAPPPPPTSQKTEIAARFTVGSLIERPR